MGWSKGKGLGANLDGNQEFVKVSHKGDQKGFGFEDRDDQWTQHEDNFNSLLKSFETKSSAVSDDGGGDVKAVKRKDDLFSCVSLEEQSQKSRARVHYKKFTRGKDMTRYSERDLANIFGKKTLNDKHAWHGAPEVLPEATNETDDLKFGVQTIETGTSVEDYFRAKMEAKLVAQRGPDGAARGNPFYVHKVEMEMTKCDGDRTEEPVEMTKKKSKKKKNKTEEIVDNVTEEIVEELPKKKSKKINNSNLSKDNDDFIVEKTKGFCNPEDDIFEIKDLAAVDGNCATNEQKKKKKKSKRKSEENLDDVSLQPIVEIPKKKSKKSSKNDDNVAAVNKSKKDKKKEVILKPIHFPILLSNVLNSLYDSAPQDSVTLCRTTAESSSTNTTSAASTTTNRTTTASSTTTVDIFELAKYKAEIFRFFDLNGFAGADNLCDIPGYGYSKNLQLRVVEGFRDDQRISSFWDQALVNKYGNEVIKIKKEFKKKKYDINQLKKKNVFKF